MADEYEKLERDGKIAVMYSPGYGAGWYSWNSEHEGLIFDKEIAELVLDRKRGKAIKLAEKKYPGIYTGGGEDLVVKWLPKGTRFEITEYDGSEGIRILTPSDGHVA